MEIRAKFQKFTEWFTINVHLLRGGTGWAH